MKMLRRRTFLRKAVSLTVGVPLADVLISCGGGGVTEQTAVPETKKTIRLGEEIDESLAKFGIRWTPDVHISFVTLPGNTRSFFLTGNGGVTYLLEGTASNDLASLVNKTPRGNLQEVWGADKFADGRYGYSGIASVLQIDRTNPQHLIGFTHNEHHAGTNLSGTFTASISQLESFDGGKTWQQIDTEPIIKGDDSMPPGTDVSGAGQPCAIIKDRYVHVYYVDWARKLVHHPDQIYLARAKIGANGSVGQYEFYQGTSFGAEETNLTPVIQTPSNTSGSYVALPSISFNTAINQLLGIVELNGAFGIATSADGMHWDTPQKIMTFTPHAKLQAGEPFISYPTLISPKEASDGTTDATGYLVYAKGSPHNMVMRQFTIS